MIKVEQLPKQPKLIYDKAIVRDYLKNTIKDAKSYFVAEHSKKGRGRIYRKRGRVHRASAAGDFPAKDTGLLLRTTKVNSNSDEAVLGTNTHYAVYLTKGTIKMAARKMYREALNAALKQENHSLDGFIRYK
jgi:hypothetical protein